MRFIGLVLLVSVGTLAGSKEVSAQQGAPIGAPIWVLQAQGDTFPPENAIEVYDDIGGFDLSHTEGDASGRALCMSEFSYYGENTLMLGAFFESEGRCKPFGGFTHGPNILRQWILTDGGGEGGQEEQETDGGDEGGQEEQEIEMDTEATDQRSGRAMTSLHRKLIRHLTEDHDMTLEEARER